MIIANTEDYRYIYLSGSVVNIFWSIWLLEVEVLVVFRIYEIIYWKEAFIVLLVMLIVGNQRDLADWLW
jgi:hypothetical protein